MKKIAIGAMLFVALGVAAHAQMNDVAYNLTVVGTGTNSAGYVLRGELEAIHVDVVGTTTGTVTVTSNDGRTLFTKASIAADATYLPVAALHTTAGAAATFNTYSQTGMVANAQAWYGKQPMAGKITVTLIGEDGATVTNNTIVTLIYSM